MSLRKIVRRILLGIFCLCAAPPVASSVICLVLTGSWVPRGGFQELGIFPGFSWSLVAPTLIVSFIGWAILTNFRPWIRALLTLLALAPLVWFYRFAPKPWTESEFFVAADYDPVSQKIYFISTQEALLDEQPPAAPSRVNAEMWLESIHPDGTQRERLVKLPAATSVSVEGLQHRGRRWYATDREVRLRLSPTRDKIAVEEYWGGVYVVNLADKRLTTLVSKPAMYEYRYDHGYPFISWWPDDEHLLLWMTHHKTWNVIARDVVVSTPASSLRPQVLWEDPPMVNIDARGRHSYPAPKRTLLWMGIVNHDLLVYDDVRGVRATPLNPNLLEVDYGRPVNLTTCWNIITGPQSNRWLTSEGDIIDEQLHVVKTLPHLQGGYHAERTPHAWSKDSIIITEPAVGLEIMNPDTGATRTILASRFVHRSQPTDEAAYQTYRQMSVAMRKATAEMQRRSAQFSQAIKQDEAEASALADGLKRRDTNTLNRARALLWRDNEAYVIALNRLTDANWDKADDLVSDFILHATNISHEYRVLWRIGECCPDRFSDTLLQIGSNLSTNNARLLEIAIPALGRVHSPAVDTCLVNIALKHRDIRVQYEALSFLFPRNRPLYTQTLQQLADDKDFMQLYNERQRNVARPPR